MVSHNVDFKINQHRRGKNANCRLETRMHYETISQTNENLDQKDGLIVYEAELDKIAVKIRHQSNQDARIVITQ